MRPNGAGASGRRYCCKGPVQTGDIPICMLGVGRNCWKGPVQTGGVPWTLELCWREKGYVRRKLGAGAAMSV